MALLLFILVPWTLAFMSDAPRQRWRQWLHFLLVIALFFFAVAVLGVDIWHLANRNEANADNALNPANDERWCCLYATLNPPACAPISVTNPCVVVPTASALSTGFTFMWSFGFLLGWMFLMLVDIIWSYYRFEKAVLHFETVRYQMNVAQRQGDLEAPATAVLSQDPTLKNQLPYHIRRQQELISAAASATKKYVGRTNKPR
jgi:hypothetical protein